MSTLDTTHARKTQADGTAGADDAPRAGIFARTMSDIVGGLFLFVLVALVALAATSTCYVSFDDGIFGNEHTFFLPDSVLINCIVVFAATGLAYFASTRPALARFRELLADDRFFRRCKAAVLALLGVVAIVWLGLTLAVPGADQGTIQKIVIAAQGGDWSAFDPDGYMNVFPNQVGYFWVSYLFAPLFKQYTSAFMQLFNVAGLLITCESLGALGGRIGASRIQQLATMCLCIAFYPIIMYCSFVYGIVWGLALSLLAIRFEMDFFDTWKWPRAILSAACIALAIVFKSNYQVFLIAMALYALVEVIDVRKLAAAVMVVLLAAAFGFASIVPNAAAEAASGSKVGSGASSWSWIAMGLQDGPRAPGWYNGYNTRSFKKAKYDSAVQAEIAKENVRKSIGEFASGERDAVAFFTKKIASQWNNPTFQGYWNVQKRRPAFKLLPPIAWFLSAEGEGAMTNYLNAVQIVILAGALIWAIACAAPRPQRRPYRQYVLPLVLLGGFICHLFWEGKCQYILPYFVLLLPLCPMGFARAALYVRKAIAALRGKGTESRSVGASAPLSKPKSTADGQAESAVEAHGVDASEQTLGRTANADRLGTSADARPFGQLVSGFFRARKGATIGFVLSCAIVAAIAVAGGYAAVTSDTADYEKWLASDPVCPIVSKEPFIGSPDADRFM